jgi:hypothetical protein
MSDEASAPQAASNNAEASTSSKEKCKLLLIGTHVFDSFCCFLSSTGFEEYGFQKTVQEERWKRSLPKKGSTETKQRKEAEMPQLQRRRATMYVPLYCFHFIWLFFPSTCWMFSTFSTGRRFKVESFVYRVQCHQACTTACSHGRRFKEEIQENGGNEKANRCPVLVFVSFIYM